MSTKPYIFNQETIENLYDLSQAYIKHFDDLPDDEQEYLIDGYEDDLADGTIESIDADNNIANVLVDLFGQETSVEVELGQIDKE